MGGMVDGLLNEVAQARQRPRPRRALAEVSALAFPRPGLGTLPRARGSAGFAPQDLSCVRGGAQV